MVRTSSARWRPLLEDVSLPWCMVMFSPVLFLFYKSNVQQVQALELQSAPSRRHDSLIVSGGIKWLETVQPGWSRNSSLPWSLYLDTGLMGFAKPPSCFLFFSRFKWRCVTDRWEATLWLSICRMFLLCLKPRTKLMRCQMQYLRAIRKARDMMGTVEFTLCAFRVIKPIDFVLCLTGAAKSRLCSYQSLKAFQTEQLHSCVTSWCL